MIKTYCDKCGNEITKCNEFTSMKVVVKFSSMPTKNMTYKLSLVERDGDYHVCRHCVFDAVYVIDDRPRDTAQ